MSEQELSEDGVLEDSDMDQKLHAIENPQARVSARKYIAESCEIAQLLPPHKRILFLMYYSHGVSKRDIAKICNCSAETVAVKLSRVSKEIHDMRTCVEDAKSGESDKGTKARIEAYFRAQKKRRRSTRGSEDS